MKVFCDSNVLFSASYSHPKGTISGLIFELSALGKFEIIISQLVKDESTNNIQIKKPQNLTILESLIEKVTIAPNIMPITDFFPSMPINDRIILNSAVSANADFFITGNTRDFKELYHKKVDSTIVLTPRDFIEKKW